MENKPEKSPLESLAKKACDEIRSLRHRNEILSAKVEMIDLFACVLHSTAAQRDEGQSLDVVWAIEKELHNLSAVKEDTSDPR